jgi:hypothetical protein
MTATARAQRSQWPRFVLQGLLELQQAAEEDEALAKAAEAKLAISREILGGRREVSRQEYLRVEQNFQKGVYEPAVALRRRAAVSAQIFANTKAWLEQLPVNSKLERVDVQSHRYRLKGAIAEQAELLEQLKQLKQAPLPGPDIRARVERRVQQWATAGRPHIFGGWAEGADIDIRFPMGEHVNHVNGDGFVRDTANPLLLAAALNPSALVDAIMVQVERLSTPPCAPCAPAERAEAIARCEAALDRVGYQIELATREEIERGETPSRFVDADPRHTLLVRVRAPKVTDNNTVNNEVREAAE